MHNNSLFHVAMQWIICVVCFLALIAVAVEAFPAESEKASVTTPNLTYAPTPPTPKKNDIPNEHVVQRPPKNSPAFLFMLYKLAAGGLNANKKRSAPLPVPTE
ncbi:hypothetical protein [Halodesulfovibrio marinisediminis]|uniref:Uncharacterized protein n=1 Tax=Halodesulfovibrio marinisediminis DSM 17456 TaxID=1121457 RepID=A0A1N6E822_9BACT|nr:hypothetical protein [Halodesulfovibrio marinisediminis]SIN79146.1 hypothetical protein SAMN02745161_0780 [Halodesulfovibrio marinisediminis DSM 17456]